MRPNLHLYCTVAHWQPHYPWLIGMCDSLHVLLLVEATLRQLRLHINARLLLRNARDESIGFFTRVVCGGSRRFEVGSLTRAKSDSVDANPCMSALRQLHIFLRWNGIRGNPSNFRSPYGAGIAATPARVFSPGK